MPTELEEPKWSAVWPRSASEMADRIRKLDWSGTPLGPVQSWPAPLRSAIDILLGCGFPATLQWGRDLILFYNDPYISLIGSRHPSALGRPLLESFPEIAETYQPLVDRVWQGEVVVLENLLFRYARADAPEDSWFDLSYGPVHNFDGSVGGILAIGLETTSRVLAEREKSRSELALLQSEQRLRRVLETDAVGVIFFNMDGFVVGANDVFLRMTGYTQTDVTSAQLHWRTLTPPEHVAASEAQMEQFAQTGRIGPYEKEYLLKDGSRRWMLFAGRALGDGTIAEYCIDISDRRAAQAALNKSERYFRALVNATSDVIFRMNADWTEMSALRGSGFLSDTDSPNRDWLNQYIHPDDQDLVLETIKLAIAGKKIVELEHRVIQTDGSVGWTFSRAIPLLDADGEITEWFGAATNITARKRAESGLRENEKLAVVGRLASSIAHEINNPLEAIVNLIYLAQRDASPEICSYLDQAQLELARVSHIATETLRFNRRTARPSATNISHLVDSVLTLHEGRIRTGQINVHRQYSHHDPILLFANELRQVIANLIGNAIDALAGQPHRELIVRVRQARDPGTGDAGVRLTVADTGIGMPPETLRRLYEPFFTTKEATGTGLGLWVARDIIQKHGGTMRVRSRSGRPSGTVFAIFIPDQPEEALPTA
ncbi:MAG TPA: PAS domain-containing protein [Acidobacteriaceae bacterium]|nr:PAS domain-containing protein [Acidobacteriaceae bacterium]